jgi:hypothetical protein
MLSMIVFGMVTTLPFTHVPPGSVAEGEALRITGRMERDARVVVHFRAAGAREAATDYASAEPLRTENGEFLFELGGSRVARPGVEYYVTVDDAPVFASAEEPYFVTVVAPEESILAASALRAHDGRRSLARVSGEWVNFGSRSPGGGMDDLADHYYRLEGDYAYSLYRTVYTIRIGGGVLRSSTFDAAALTPFPTGLDYGFAEIRWRLAESVFVDTRGVLGADDTGFQPGGAATLILGKPESVYVALGGEVMGRIGSQGFLKLHWDTVRTVPMAATVALTDFPSETRPTGVRMIYEASHEMGPVTVVAQVGYQARDIHVGGISLGMGLEHAF